MVIKPKIRGFVCITSHPDGCAAHVREQVATVRANGKLPTGPKKVLVLGASTGYGLASRIAAAFGSGAATLGVFFERESTNGRPATAGYYNSVAFEQQARAEGLYAKSINGDAFSDEIRREVIDTIKADLGQVDMVVYSLASPRRTDPKTGETHKSVLKPIGQSYTNKSVDTDKDRITEVTIDAANEQEIADTIKVMGGEDWQMWIDALRDAGALTDDAITLAYSYIGPTVTHGIYRDGTIGKAKEDLEATAAALRETGLKAYVSVNKAVVTQASSAIPVVPLYISILFKIMKEKGLHEGCVEQMDRLFREKLFRADGPELDERQLLRVDDWEMREDVQAAVAELWPQVTTDNLRELTDYTGYEAEFLKLFGFGLGGVDYEAEVEVDRQLGYA